MCIISHLSIFTCTDHSTHHSFSSKSKCRYLAVSRQATAKRATLRSLFEVDSLHIRGEPTTNMSPIHDIEGVPFLIGRVCYGHRKAACSEFLTVSVHSRIFLIEEAWSYLLCKLEPCLSKTEGTRCKCPISD